MSGCHANTALFICRLPYSNLKFYRWVDSRPGSTDSSFSIIDGEYLLESSLHPAPVSLWLAFSCKEKKKSNRNRSESYIKALTKRTKLMLLCFTLLWLSIASKLMFYSHQYHLSRNHQYLDMKYRKFYLRCPSCTKSTSIYVVEHLLCQVWFSQILFIPVQFLRTRWITQETEITSEIALFICQRIWHAISSFAITKNMI